MTFSEEPAGKDKEKDSQITQSDPSKQNRYDAIAATSPYQAYLESLRQRHQSPETVRSACFAFMHLDHFRRTTCLCLPDVTTDDLDRFHFFLNSRGLAPTTSGLVLRHVRRLFGWLAQTAQIFLDPAADWSLPKARQPLLKVPTAKQVTRLLHNRTSHAPGGSVTAP